MPYGARITGSSKRHRHKRKQHGAADRAGDGGGGVPETKSDEKTDAGWEPATTTRGAVPQLARDADIAPPASSAPANNAALPVAGAQVSGGVRAGERPGRQVTFAGGPGT